MTTHSLAGYARSVRNGVPLITWPIFEGSGVTAGVTTHAGGVSAGAYASLNLGLQVGDRAADVIENRRRVALAFDAGLDDLIIARQVHEASVRVVGVAERGRGARGDDGPPATDALVTADPGVLLAVLVADCVPLVIFDPVVRILACVHAGWRGTVRGVSVATVERMRELGAEPARLLVGIGPAIHADRYQVGEEVASSAAEAFGPRLDDVLRRQASAAEGGDAWTFDLWRANEIQLTQAGVLPERIAVAALDTGPGTQFFSHRSQAPTGRFAALARINT